MSFKLLVWLQTHCLLSTNEILSASWQFSDLQCTFWAPMKYCYCQLAGSSQTYSIPFGHQWNTVTVSWLAVLRPTVYLLNTNEILSLSASSFTDLFLILSFLLILSAFEFQYQFIYCNKQCITLQSVTIQHSLLHCNQQTSGQQVSVYMDACLCVSLYMCVFPS